MADLSQWESNVLDLDSLLQKYDAINKIVAPRLQELADYFNAILDDEFQNHEKAQVIVSYDQLFNLVDTYGKFRKGFDEVGNIYWELIRKAHSNFKMRDLHEYGKQVHTILVPEVKTRTPKPMDIKGMVSKLSASDIEKLKAILAKK